MARTGKKNVGAHLSSCVMIICLVILVFSSAAADNNVDNPHVHESHSSSKEASDVSDESFSISRAGMMANSKEEERKDLKPIRQDLEPTHKLRGSSKGRLGVGRPKFKENTGDSAEVIAGRSGGDGGYSLSTSRSKRIKWLIKTLMEGFIGQPPEPPVAFLLSI